MVRPLFKWKITLLELIVLFSIYNSLIAICVLILHVECKFVVLVSLYKIKITLK